MHTHPSHFGPGSQHGKPYYPLGQECSRPAASKGPAVAPLSLGRTAHRQTAPNRHEEEALRAYAEPPSQRSCAAACNKDGGGMDSRSHCWKIGSKHIGDRRQMRSASSGARRGPLRDPTPWHFNAAFSTTGDAVGKFYSSHLISQPLLLSRTRFDWVEGKRHL